VCSCNTCTYQSITYHRLLNIPTTKDFDEAFAFQSATNYREIIDGRPPEEFHHPGTVNQVLMVEREAVMCSSIAQAAQHTNPAGCVVGVVGESHLPGLHRMWADGSWEKVAKTAFDKPFSKEPFLDDTQAAVKRALLESTLRLHCRSEVLADLQTVLGPVPSEQQDPYSYTVELYGTPRMLMAVLSEELLPEVCGRRKGSFSELLEPLRAVRPVNGGPGFDVDLIMKLRLLHFQIN